MCRRSGDHRRTHPPPRVGVDLLACAKVIRIELLGEESKRHRLIPGEALKLKGFQQPVQSYALAAA